MHCFGANHGDFGVGFHEAFGRLGGLFACTILAHHSHHQIWPRLSLPLNEEAFVTLPLSSPIDDRETDDENLHMLSMSLI